MRSTLELVALPPLMKHTRGRPGVPVGVIDGRITSDACLRSAAIEFVDSELDPASGQGDDDAAIHATSIATILVGAGCPEALGICPGVRLLNYPLFGRRRAGEVNAEHIAAAIVETVDAGARVLNLSFVVNVTDSWSELAIGEALDYAARSGAIIVAATSNQAQAGGAIITRHRAVVPVVAYELSGLPFQRSTLTRSVGLRGVGAPGEVDSSAFELGNAGSGGRQRAMRGTSVATAIVTGAVALLWSEYTQAAASHVAAAIRGSVGARSSLIPGLFDAWWAYELLRAAERIGSDGPWTTIPNSTGSARHDLRRGCPDSSTMTISGWAMS
jgi:subtilisin family serine protease